MPDIGVREMATSQVSPNPKVIARQPRKGRDGRSRLKAGVHGLVATLMIVASALAACTSRGDDAQPGGSGPTSSPDSTSTATPIPASGALEPGTYAFSTLVPDFDASYRITMDVPDGYEAFEGWAVDKLGEGKGVSVWIVDNVYTDPCEWGGTLPDPPVGSSVDGLVAALASQKGRHASTPSEVTVDGFSGMYLELTVPAGIDLADCDSGQFRTWVDPNGWSAIPRSWSARPALDRRRRRRSSRDRCRARGGGDGA